MWPLAIGAMVGAGANLLGGVLGSQATAAANAANIQAANAATLWNTAHQSAINEQNIALQRETNAANIAAQEGINLRNVASQERINAALIADKERDRALQEDFARMGIQWRVEDSRAAGVHPLFGLGGAGASYTPSALSLGAVQEQASMGTAPRAGGYPSALAATIQPDMSMGRALAGMGQDISRAFMASHAVRNDVLDSTMQALQLRNYELRNDLLAAQIAKMRQPGTSPGKDDNSISTAAGGASLYPGFDDEFTRAVRQGHFKISDDSAERTALMMGGHRVRTSENTSDSQKVEDRYGDIIEAAYGAGLLAWDVAGYGARLIDRAVKGVEGYFSNAQPLPIRPTYRGRRI